MESRRGSASDPSSRRRAAEVSIVSACAGAKRRDAGRPSAWSPPGTSRLIFSRPTSSPTSATATRAPRISRRVPIPWASARTKRSGRGFPRASTAPMRCIARLSRMTATGGSRVASRHRGETQTAGSALRAVRRCELVGTQTFSRICTAQALPMPTTWVSPIFAPSTWRPPASPRRCVVTS